MHDSQDSDRRTRIEAPGSKRKWGWERREGEGREGGRTFSAAAGGRRWKEEEDGNERGRMRTEGGDYFPMARWTSSEARAIRSGVPKERLFIASA